MKAPHLCWVVEPPASFAPLVAAARDLGLRVGWLDLGPFAAVPELTPAARAGMAQSVAVGGGASLALKPIAGLPVLGDLIRGHFLGCRLVLLSGDPAAPGVRIDERYAAGRLWRVGGDPNAEDRDAGARFRLVTASGEEHTLGAGQLAARLRRPHWR